jgi:hypothetical protein
LFKHFSYCFNDHCRYLLYLTFYFLSLPISLSPSLPHSLSIYFSLFLSLSLSLSFSSSRKAITSSYFPKSDAILLKDFHHNIMDSGVIELNNRLLSKSNADRGDYGEGLSTFNPALFSQFSEIVTTCCAIHRI